MEFITCHKEDLASVSVWDEGKQPYRVNRFFFCARPDSIFIEWYPIRTRRQAGRRFIFTNKYSVEWEGQFVPSKFNPNHVITSQPIPSTGAFTTFIHQLEKRVERAYDEWGRFRFDRHTLKSFIEDCHYHLHCSNTIPVRRYSEWAYDRPSSFEEMNACTEGKQIMIVMELTGITRITKEEYPPTYKVTIKPHAIYWGTTCLPDIETREKSVNKALQLEHERRNFTLLTRKRHRTENPSGFNWVRNILKYIIPSGYKDCEECDVDDDGGYFGSNITEKMQHIENVYRETKSVAETRKEIMLKLETAESFFESCYATQPSTVTDWIIMHTDGFIIELYKYALALFTHLEDYEHLTIKNVASEYKEWMERYKPIITNSEEELKMNLEEHVKQYFVERMLNRCVHLGAKVAEVRHNRYVEDIFEDSLIALLPSTVKFM